MNSGQHNVKCGKNSSVFTPVHLLVLAVLLILSRGVVPASADELLILQSGGLQPYAEAAVGVSTALSSMSNWRGPKALLPFTVDKMVLDSETDDASLRDTLMQRQLSAVVAIGKRALTLALQLPGVPVIHVMVPGAEQIIGARENVSGISMTIPAVVTLSKLQIHYPRVHRIAVLYHPVYSGKFVREAEDAASQLGLELVAIPTSSPAEVDQLLNALHEKVEALWMIPDPNVLSEQTVQTFLDFSIKKRILLLTFAEKYLKTGATFGVAANNTEMGRAAGRMVVDLLEGKNRTLGASRSLVTYRIFKNSELLDRIATLDMPPAHLP